MMGWWNKMVRDAVFEKGYPSWEAVNGDMRMVEQETDGMWCEEFSEPMTDLDYESEQP